MQGVPRTSSLFSPIMLLEGHEGEVFACEFHPEGEHLMSTGFDRKICKYQHSQNFRSEPKKKSLQMNVKNMLFPFSAMECIW